MPRQTTAPTDEKRQRQAAELLQRLREAPHCGHIVFFEFPMTMALVIEHSKDRRNRKRERRGT